MTTDQASQAAFWSAFRTILSALGGTFLVARGFTDQQTLQDVIGAIMVLAPLIWGVVSKFRAEGKTQARENAALQAGVIAERQGDSRVAVPAEAIDPEHAQAIIQEVKEDKR